MSILQKGLLTFFYLFQLKTLLVFKGTNPLIGGAKLINQAWDWSCESIAHFSFPWVLSTVMPFNVLAFPSYIPLLRLPIPSDHHKRSQVC